jgi:multicomponent Na+:H+ antiporter subunit F
MNEVVMISFQAALIVLVGLLLPVSYRILIGPGPTERLQALETLNILLIGVLIVLALLQGAGMMVDVALALAAFSFIATLGIARYVSQGRVF